MYTNRFIVGALILSMPAIVPVLASAQARGASSGGTNVAFTAARPLEILNVESQEGIPGIANAPFTADASTEFTQILADGNRIERRFTTSLARDGRGRTRQEQEVAMLSQLFVVHDTVLGRGAPQQFNVQMGAVGRGTGAATAGEPPRFVVITDPVEGVTFTLDDQRKSARRTRMSPATRAIELDKMRLTYRATVAGQAFHDAASEPVIEALGSRQFEGVTAEGTRSTTTIPAGEIGNLNPIKLVTERWFSKELQMAVLITRSDPRSGDTSYRLTNIVRAEPPPDLFTVPSDYQVLDLNSPRLTPDWGVTAPRK